ncbi:DnaD domain protein [Neobacillus cucumis]|uniref:DnaD domain protein n=1 Tax=Neobacillus cucumis TaxID=1740721 RepID=UPI0035A95B30
MAKYRIVRTDFWQNPIVSEEMTPEDKYFYLYLLTNPNTTQIGIYKITKKQMAFDLGYSIESVNSLMERFTLHHKLIRYNPVSRELAIKNWGKDNLHKGGKPVMDCIYSELKEVEDPSLIQYVAEAIRKQDIRSLYESFCQQEEMLLVDEKSGQEEHETFQDSECEELDNTFTCPNKIREQKEIEALHPNLEKNRDIEKPLLNNQNDVREIVEFWDSNGFGFSNINAKQQLLAWVEDSSFLHPKEVILKAMNIACANNKRRLSYVVGILKNWENESLLTVEEIDSHHENQKSVPKHKQSAISTGRQIPRGFELDLTAGEE